MTTKPDLINPPHEPVGPTAVAAWLVGPAFLLMAAWFLWFASPAEIPAAGTPDFSSTLLVPIVRDAVQQDPPRTSIGTFDYTCNDCHRVFDPGEERGERRVQHLDITLQHGLNNECYNCHDRDNRDKLVGHRGQLIGYDETQTLCAQCHGRVYRDWTRGTHGKSIGAWDQTSADYQRLECVSCHDPHAPMYGQLQPLPGPHTLRMGEPETGHHAAVGAKRNPLMQWSESGGTHDQTDHNQAESDGGGHEE